MAANLDRFKPVTIRGVVCLSSTESAKYLNRAPATLRNILKRRSDEGRGIEPRYLEGHGSTVYLPVEALDAIKEGREVPEQFLIRVEH